MFKIICQIGKKFTEKDQDLFYFYNCQPCAFNHYQLFHHKDNKSTTKQKAQYATALTQKMLFKVNELHHDDLYHKLYNIQNLSPYRYITLFDERTNPEDINSLSSTAIFDVIIRLTESDTSDKYSTIWESIVEFNLNQYEFSHTKLATIRQSSPYTNQLNSNPYTIDKLFLKLLLDTHEISQCSAIEDLPYNVKMSYTDDIYNNVYKNNIKLLVASEYLHFLMNRHICITKYHEAILLKSNIVEFILPSKHYTSDHFTISDVASICNNLGSSKLPISSVVDIYVQHCKQQEDYYGGFESTLGNELYQFNCHNIDEIVMILGDVIYLDNY